jgi:Flp pilus assembly protein TadB
MCLKMKKKRKKKKRKSNDIMSRNGKEKKERVSTVSYREKRKKTKNHIEKIERKEGYKGKEIDIAFHYAMHALLRFLIFITNLTFKNDSKMIEERFEKRGEEERLRTVRYWWKKKRENRESQSIKMEANKEEERINHICQNLLSRFDPVNTTLKSSILKFEVETSREGGIGQMYQVRQMVVHVN